MLENLTETDAVHSVVPPSIRRQFEARTVDFPGLHSVGASKLSNIRFDQIKSQIHRQILEEMDLRRLEKLPPERLRAELKSLTESLIGQNHFVLNEVERIQIGQGIQDEMLGLGPIEPLLSDETVSDILVNGPFKVFVERRGKIELTLIRFENDAHLLRVIDRIVSRMGRRIDEMSPMVDARLADGSRVNAVIAPLAIDGPLLSIRRFAVVPYTMKDLLDFGTMTADMACLMDGVIRAKLNVLISGGTGSGKTTLLNVVSASIPPNERIVTIEDAAELQLQQPHVVRMETRPPNMEGVGEVSQRALLRNSLRMRPDRIILGEVRGVEVMDMLQAMNTGHEGSMSTIHANTPRHAMTRLEHMLGMAGMQTDTRSLRQQIAGALTVVIQVSRLSDGKRKITSMQEITGMEGDVITMQEIFKYEQTGLSSDAQVQGRFVATGIRPRFVQRLHTRGIELNPAMFTLEGAAP
ncbi:CpaF family protein [Limnohabitans sp. Jir72]|uniref:CpaF family protein n=1 Tax=Limnohabitans sp. Jir72 TaxID=1977909 RepID=UPI000D3B40F9|nr:CpaF family protein [Limnohabitans sp. Jir72]PUE33332.1 pilus assembly protein CpaF [Limnohabitans sp. Jir72]